MRISVREEDPGYANDAYQYTVKIDGTNAKYCFTADEEAGEAWVYTGRYIPNDDGVLILEEKCLLGKVEVTNPNSCPICDGPTKRETRAGKTGDWCDPCKSLSMPIEDLLKPVKEEPPPAPPNPEPGQTEKKIK